MRLVFKMRNISEVKNELEFGFAILVNFLEFNFNYRLYIYVIS